MKTYNFLGSFEDVARAGVLDLLDSGDDVRCVVEKRFLCPDDIPEERGLYYEDPERTIERALDYATMDPCCPPGSLEFSREEFLAMDARRNAAASLLHGEITSEALDQFTPDEIAALLPDIFGVNSQDETQEDAMPDEIDLPEDRLRSKDGMRRHVKPLDDRLFVRRCHEYGRRGRKKRADLSIYRMAAVKNALCLDHGMKSGADAAALMPRI